MLVLSGDVPLISAETIAGLLEAHAASAAAATMLTIELDDPGAYGRVVRDRRGPGRAGGRGQSRRRRRSPSSWRSARSTPAPTPSTPRRWPRALAGLSNDNAQGEYYLPDVFPALREAGHAVAAHLADDLAVTMGVNNRADLAAVEAEARRRILEAPHARRRHRRRPRLDLGRRRGRDRRRRPASSPAPACAASSTVGAGSVVGPLTTLIDTRLGERVSVPHSYLVECEVLDGCTVGPFAYLRPGRRARARRQGGHLRRDQELAHRRGGEGPPPLLHRRRRRRRRQQSRAPARSPPTTTDSARTGP